MVIIFKKRTSWKKNKSVFIQNLFYFKNPQLSNKMSNEKPLKIQLLERMYKMVSDKNSVSDSEIEEFLKEYHKDFDINEINKSSGNPILICAVLSQRSFNVFKLLLELGADYNKRSQSGSHILAFLIYDAEIEKLDYLVSFHTQKTRCTVADGWYWKDFRDNHGTPLLHMALEHSGLKTKTAIRWLLDVAKVNIESRGYFGRTPLMCAAKSIHMNAINKEYRFEIFKMLIEEYGANPDPDYGEQDTSVGSYLVSDEVGLEIFKWWETRVGIAAMLRISPKLNTTLLHFAVEAKSMQFVKYIVQRFREFYPEKNLAKDYVDVKQYPDLFRKNALYFAAQKSFLECVQFLVEECGADPSDDFHRNSYDSKTLALACCSNIFVQTSLIPGTLKYLVEQCGCECGEIPKPRTRTCAHALAERSISSNDDERSVLDCFKFLASRGVDFSMKDYNDKTPLDLASAKENSAGCKLLRDWGEDPAKYFVSRTVLHSTYLKCHHLAQNMRIQLQSLQQNFSENSMDQKIDALERDILIMKTATSDSSVLLKRNNNNENINQNNKQAVVVASPKSSGKEEETYFTSTQRVALGKMAERVKSSQNEASIASIAAVMMGCWCFAVVFDEFLKNRN
jgi:ankyrin repeat protein